MESIMDKTQEVEGKFKFDQDTKRFHRFRIECDSDLVNGTIYIKKERNGARLPKKITLTYADNATN
jgi:hypothetical protein